MKEWEIPMIEEIDISMSQGGDEGLQTEEELYGLYGNIVINDTANWNKAIKGATDS